MRPKWRIFTLPHDWSIEGQLSPSLASCTGYLPGGIGWYRKHFKITDDAPRHYIYFEGVYNRSEVYLKRHLLAMLTVISHFSNDIILYLKEGDNVLSVRVEAIRHDICPILYTNGNQHSGYGPHVHLTRCPPLSDKESCRREMRYNR